MAERAVLSQLPRSMQERAVRARQLASTDPDLVSVDDQMLPWIWDPIAEVWYSFDGNIKSFKARTMADSEFFRGKCFDYGEGWAEITSAFDFSPLGVELHPTCLGVNDSYGCRQLAGFLLRAADWLDATRSTKTIPVGVVVYAITDGNDHHKIGKAVNVGKRIKQLQTGNGRKLKLAAYLPCPCEFTAYRVEAAAQRSLSEFQAMGEWFCCNTSNAVQALYEGADAVGLMERPIVLVDDTEATDGR